ncbi:MAG: hypothetical protein E7H54_04465 [Clostridium perfringens]|nr:hypothetical protein [Clostridium perfringens]
MNKVSSRDLDSFKRQYIGLLKGVKREGIENLIKYLESTDFFVAPASVNRHSCFRGGLLIHSLSVYHLLRDRVKYYSARVGVKMNYSEDSIRIVSLLHDVCKVNCFIPKYDRSAGYNYVNHFPIGHGEKSVIRILKYIDLTEEEMLAIRWHMGNLFDNQSKDLARAIKQCNLVILLQHADVEASTFLNL